MAKHGLPVHLARRQGLLSVATTTWCGLEWSAKLKVAHSPKQANCDDCKRHKDRAAVPHSTTVNGTPIQKGHPSWRPAPQ